MWKESLSLGVDTGKSFQFLHWFVILCSSRSTTEFVLTNLGGGGCLSTSLVTKFQKSGLAVIFLSTYLILGSNLLSISSRDLSGLTFTVQKETICVFASFTMMIYILNFTVQNWARDIKQWRIKLQNGRNHVYNWSREKWID